MSIMCKTLKDFKRLLKKRFAREEEKKDISTTEAAIRYAFFYSLATKGNYRLEDMTLEEQFTCPEFKKNRDRLDLHVLSRSKECNLIFEFKYHNEKKTSRTDSAAAILWDFVRLRVEIGERRRTKAYFVYVFDSATRNYLNKRSRTLFERIFSPSGNLVRVDMIELRKISEKLKTFKSYLEGRSVKSFCVKKIIPCERISQLRFLFMCEIRK